MRRTAIQALNYLSDNITGEDEELLDDDDSDYKDEEEEWIDEEWSDCSSDIDADFIEQDTDENVMNDLFTAQDNNYVWQMEPVLQRSRQKAANIVHERSGPKPHINPTTPLEAFPTVF